MKRRQFLKTAALVGAGLTLTDLLGLDLLEGAERADLSVVKGASPAKVTRSAINALGGIGRFVSKGDIVVVKPNIGWDRRPEQAATTNPEVVAELVRLCVEAGAKKVKVFDRPCNDARRCYKQSGIADAARAAGAEVSFMDDRKYKEKALNGRALKSWPLYSEVLDADKVINVPIAKVHGLAGLTLGLKNWMGVMGGWRSRIHQNLDESLPDVAAAIRPALTIIDAVRILTANGPQGGDLADVKILNTVIAGADPVAVDSYGTTLFGMKAKDLNLLRVAEEAGLGRRDLSRIKIRRFSI